jgi:hypothetical protein
LRLNSKLGASLVAAALLVIGSSLPAAAAPTCVSAATDAQDLRAANKLREARALFLVCARPTCNAVVRSGCEKWVKEVDEQQPSIVIRAVDARGRDVLGVRATIDETATELDGSPVLVDPGPHVVRVKAKSGDVVERPVLIALGEKARVIELRFNGPLAQDGTRAAEEEPEVVKDKDKEKPVEKSDRTTAPSSKGGSPIPLVLLGVGTIALGVFTYFEIEGQSNYSGLENGCYRVKSCTSDDIDPVRTQFVVAGVALGVAAVALTAAALIYFAGGSSTPPSTKPPRAAAASAPFRLEHGALRF